MGRPHVYPEEFRREACELVRRGDRILGADGSPLRQLVLDPDHDYQRMP